MALTEDHANEGDEMKNDRHAATARCSPLTDALIEKLDAEHRTNMPFVIRQIVNHAKAMERRAAEAADIGLALSGYLDTDHPDEYTLQQEAKLREISKSAPSESAASTRDAALEEAVELCKQESVKLYAKYCEASSRDWQRSAQALSIQAQEAAALAASIRALKSPAIAAPSATPSAIGTRAEKKDWGRAKVGMDGNCGYALLGADLQSGEAEFVEVEGWPQPTYRQERDAWGKALKKLEARLRSGPLRYEVIR